MTMGQEMGPDLGLSEDVLAEEPTAADDDGVGGVGGLPPEDFSTLRHAGTPAGPYIPEGVCDPGGLRAGGVPGGLGGGFGCHPSG